MKLSNGQEIEIRGLKWREKRALTKQGVKLETLEKADPGKIDDAVEKVIKVVYPELNIDELDVVEVYEIFAKVMEATFPSEETVKNSG